MNPLSSERSRCCRVAFNVVNHKHRFPKGFHGLSSRIGGACAILILVSMLSRNPSSLGDGPIHGGGGSGAALGIFQDDGREEDNDRCGRYCVHRFRLVIWAGSHHDSACLQGQSTPWATCIFEFEFDYFRVSHASRVRAGEMSGKIRSAAFSFTCHFVAAFPCRVFCCATVVHVGATDAKSAQRGEDKIIFAIRIAFFDKCAFSKIYLFMLKGFRRSIPRMFGDVRIWFFVLSFLVGECRVAGPSFLRAAGHGTASLGDVVEMSKNAEALGWISSVLRD